MRTSPGKQPQRAPAVVWVPHHPVLFDRMDHNPEYMREYQNHSYDLRPHEQQTPANASLLILILHHVSRVGLFNGLGKEVVK